MKVLFKEKVHFTILSVSFVFLLIIKKEKEKKKESIFIFLIPKTTLILIFCSKIKL